ncbi:MAG: hypothetical protein IH987_07345 [Planctomycetes bacterium]|nr:hypothetical protein [Planctomycetota bacterium]
MNEAKRNRWPDEYRNCELSRGCGESPGISRPWLFGIADHAAPSRLLSDCRAAVDAGFAGIHFADTEVPPVVAGTIELSEAARTLEEVTRDGGFHAVTLVTPVGRLAESQQRVRSWLGRNAGRRNRWLRLAIHGDPGPPRTSESEIGNRLYDLLLELRFDIEASGLTVAVDLSVLAPQLCAIALRELVDAVGSSAIGICARIEIGGEEVDPATLLSQLNYRANMVRICIAHATSGSGAGVGVIRQAAPALPQFLAEVPSHSPIIVEGVADPHAARLLIESWRGFQPGLSGATGR